MIRGLGITRGWVCFGSCGGIAHRPCSRRRSAQPGLGSPSSTRAAKIGSENSSPDPCCKISCWAPRKIPWGALEGNFSFSGPHPERSRRIKGRASEKPASSFDSAQDEAQRVYRPSRARPGISGDASGLPRMRSRIKSGTVGVRTGSSLAPPSPRRLLISLLAMSELCPLRGRKRTLGFAVLELRAQPSHDFIVLKI